MGEERETTTESTTTEAPDGTTVETQSTETSTESE